MRENFTQEYLSDWRKNENANSIISIGAMRSYVADKDMALYTLEKLPEDIRELHNKGYVHLHDLGMGITLYCMGHSLQDLILKGLWNGKIGTVRSKPAKHFDALLGQIMNFFFLLQTESAGAQSFSNFDTFLSPYVYYDKLSYNEVKQALQNFIYSLNQPLRAGSQSPFTNLTLDGYNKDLDDTIVVYAGKYLKDKTYKDFKKERLMIFKAFTEILTEGDGMGQTFTFPIPTINISKDFDFNSELFDLVLENTKKYGNFYFANYVNSVLDPNDARSMCPLDKHEKVLIRDRGNLKLIEIGKLGGKDIYEIYSDGKFVHGKFQVHPNQEMMTVKLANHHQIKMSVNHLNFVKKEKGLPIEELTGQQLKEGYYLPYSIKAYDGEGGNYELGYIVGAYAGDGSKDEYQVIFSLNNTTKLSVVNKLKEYIVKYFTSSTQINIKNNDKVVFVIAKSPALISYVAQFVNGSNALDKELNGIVFEMSKEFRQGLLDGYNATDGVTTQNIYRISTSSPKMKDSLIMLASSLGMITSIFEDNREGRFGHNTNYVVTFNTLTYKNYGDKYFEEDGYIWYKIDKIIYNNRTDTAYCFEVIDDVPMFTVGTSGVLTHNCRLRLDLSQLRKHHHSTGGLFGSSEKTGSVAVSTINLPLLAYESNSEAEFFQKLDNIMEKMGEYHKIKREIVEDTIEKGLTPYIAYYYGDVKKRYGSYTANHFSTIGMIGMEETIKNLFGKEYNMFTHKEFAQKVLDFMLDKELKLQEKYEFLFNLEETPAEGASYRLAMKAKELHPDIITADEETPYFTNGVLPHVSSTNNPFKLADNQDQLVSKFTSGSVVHFFLDETPSLNSLRAFIKTIIERTDIPYFTITPTFGICPIHGYIPGNFDYCPYCEAESNKDNENGPEFIIGV